LHQNFCAEKEHSYEVLTYKKKQNKKTLIHGQILAPGKENGCAFFKLIPAFSDHPRMKIPEGNGGQ